METAEEKIISIRASFMMLNKLVGCRVVVAGERGGYKGEEGTPPVIALLLGSVSLGHILLLHKACYLSPCEDTVGK